MLLSVDHTVLHGSVYDSTSSQQDILGSVLVGNIFSVPDCCILCVNLQNFLMFTSAESLWPCTYNYILHSGVSDVTWRGWKGWTGAWVWGQSMLQTGLAKVIDSYTTSCLFLYFKFTFRCYLSSQMWHWSVAKALFVDCHVIYKTCTCLKNLDIFISFKIWTSVEVVIIIYLPSNWHSLATLGIGHRDMPRTEWIQINSAI
jgi:hypothetical protein